MGEPDSLIPCNKNLPSIYYMLDVLSAWELSMNMTDMDSILLELPWLVGKEDIKQALQTRERERC